ncbi:MAG: hypothetical protein ACOYN4_05575 [Bacteroidales bacterium]
MVTITPEELALSAKKFRKDLLMMPVIALATSLNHMTLRVGIRGKETVGELDGDIELGPYSETRTDTNGATIKGRDLETYFGSVIKNFSPNSVAMSIYGDSVLSGQGLTNTQITQMVLAFLAKKISKNINKVLWSAVRNSNGTGTADLFNGFDTITAADITANKITTAIGNLQNLGAAITVNNACDTLKAIYRNSSDELQGEATKMFISKTVYNFYNDDYQASHGALPYNTAFKKTFLEGSDDLCELVALPNKKNSPYIHLTTKSNMLVGVDQMSDVETITVEKHAAFVLQFVMAMFFGVQFETVSPQRLCVAKLYVAPVTP